MAEISMSITSLLIMSMPDIPHYRPGHCVQSLRPASARCGHEHAEMENYLLCRMLHLTE